MQMKARFIDLYFYTALDYWRDSMSLAQVCICIFLASTYYASCIYLEEFLSFIFGKRPQTSTNAITDLTRINTIYHTVATKSTRQNMANWISNQDTQSNKYRTFTRIKYVTNVLWSYVLTEQTSIRTTIPISVNTLLHLQSSQLHLNLENKGKLTRNL